MSRFNNLASQRRELSFIVHRLTTYSTLADREILEARLKALLTQNLSNEFFDMAEDVFSRLKETNPSLVDEIRGLFFNMLSEAKYELRTETETTTMMTVGVFLTSIFKITPPKTILDEKTAEDISALLKRFYINPKAKIVIHHELLRSNQGPANNTEMSRPLLEKMKAAEGCLYTGDRFDYPDGPDDPIRSQEHDRRYGLYLFHMIIAVTVPAGELTVVHPYRWSQAPSANMIQEGADKAVFDPNNITANPWNIAASLALYRNIANYNPILTEPFPIIRGLDFLEQLMAPFRILPFVMNAVHSAGCSPEDICASIALFCSRPDAEKIYANEIRIALARKSDRSHPFSGDCITLHDLNEDVNVISGNIERFMQMLKLNDIVFHEEARYFEREDANGRIFVNAEGISTTLCAPGEFGAPDIPKNLLN